LGVMAGKPFQAILKTKNQQKSDVIKTFTESGEP